MDFTALELSLRNRQLLQVKCFLRIQIETFRYVVMEEFNQSGLSEQMIALEKFFLHDWQNIVNKISSFATIQMSGDYTSKIFSTLLYRSLIYSCNQLILIVSSISSGVHVIPAESSLLSITEDQLNVFKEKILMLLIKQINSIRENLSKIYSSDSNLFISASDRPCTSTSVEQDKSFESDSLSTEGLLNTENIDRKTPISIKTEKFQELFEHSIVQECIPLFMWFVKKYFQEQSNTWNDQLLWENMIEKIINFTFSKIKSEDIDTGIIEQINSYLLQTGLPVFDLLFSLFLQTCDAMVRQKLLHIFCICFNDSLKEDPAAKIIYKTNNFEKFKSKFGDYFRIMSIIDMYIFSFRTKFNNDAEKLELSIEWILETNSDLALTKSFLLPVLNEIIIRPNLFVDWQELTGQIHNLVIFDPFRKYIFLEENFNSYITSEFLWQYLIDNNEITILVQWIEKDHVQMPYCEKIKPNDLETCYKMIHYLLNHSPSMLILEIFTALISNPYFFNHQDFSDLILNVLNFENFLGLIGRTGIFDAEELQKYSILEKLLNKVIKLSQLVEYCIKNELFEFLFLLYNRYKIDFNVFLSSRFRFECPNMFNLLQFLHKLCSSHGAGHLKNTVYEKSLFIHRFLNDNKNLNLNQKFSFKEDIVLILKNMSFKSVDLDLILFILSFSQKETFDNFFAVLKQLYQHEPSVRNLVESFFKNLNSKYPLIYQANLIINSKMKNNKNNGFHSSTNHLVGVDDDNFFSLSQQALGYNIYTFLQQAISSVNIAKVFEWRINQKKTQNANQIGKIQNNELVHFSHKRLIELYGLKSNLNISFYLKNLRFIEAFSFFNSMNTSTSTGDLKLKSPQEISYMTINEKFAIKAVKKAATIGYFSLKNISIIASCLLFQSLIKSCFPPSLDNNSDTKLLTKDTFEKNINSECEKFRLHLILGRLIIEYADNFPNFQNIQQKVFATLLRKSHFNANRICSQKLLDLAVMAIERKYSKSSSQSSSCLFKKQKPNVDIKLFSWFFQDSTETNDLISMIESCPLLVECFEWKPLLRFADFYSLKKPLNFLKKCTNEDNWLMFVIFAQLYEISKEEMQTVLSTSDFNNKCIGEHLFKAFRNSHHMNMTILNETDSIIFKTKQAQNLQNVLHSELFKDKSPSPRVVSPENISPHCIPKLSDVEKIKFPLENDSPENLSLFSSFFSDENTSNNCVLFEKLLNPYTSSKYFLQLILDIYRNCVSYSNQFGFRSPSFSIEASFQMTLLYASVSLSNPILALLACSLERKQAQKNIKSSSTAILNSPQHINRELAHLKNSSISFDRLKYPSFACWLLASVNLHSKQSFIDWYCQTNSINPNSDSLADCFINWSPDRLLCLINMLTTNDAKHFQLILQGFKIFKINIPILHVLLEFLIGFLVMKDYYQTSSLLLQFQSLLVEYNEEEFLQSNGISLFYESEDSTSNEFNWLISDFYTRSWIEKCSIIIIINSLLIAKQFELGILLSHYNFARIQDSFSSEIHHVPDIRKFYLFSECLCKAPNYTLPIAELLLIQQNPDEPEPRYGDVLNKFIYNLQESGHFEVARNLINLMNVSATDTDEFIINEWMLKAKKAELDKESSSTPYNDIDISFWEDCWSQVSKLDPSMHSAFKVMKLFVQKLKTSQILVKCFVLLKCLLSLETILKSSVENRSKNDSLSNLSIHDDSFTVCSSNTSNNFDLIQDYFNFEVSLWKSVVECEFYIQTTFTNNDLQNNIEQHSSSDNRNDKSFVSTWQDIWKEIVSYFNLSIISKIILPKLNEKNSFLFKNVQNQRDKRVIFLEVFKREALNKVIRNLLDFFCYAKAQEVSKLFNYSHDDFEIIKACDQTARGLLKDICDAPLNVQLKMKHSDAPNSFEKFRTNISAFNLSSEQKKTISMLETFSGLATIGQKFCEYILLHYKIACFLGKSYSELKDSEFSPGKLLEMLLFSNQSENYMLENRFPEDDGVNTSEQVNQNHISLIDKYMETILCAKEFIRIVGRVDDRLINEEKAVDLLAQFVFQDVQRIVERQFKDLSDEFLFTEIEFDRAQLEFYSARFSVLIRLLREPYLLGHKLLELIKKSRTFFENIWNGFYDNVSLVYQDEPIEINSEKEIYFIIAKRKHYVQMVELYIRAHESFTAQCDVGGIAIVLRKIHILITQELKPARYFHLILRLLTGIGRYSEMTYCFNLFRECDRFELILSKRVQRTPQLRIALLNYLKIAENIDELLPLVAIRFFLYRETADQHLFCAEKLLSELNFNNISVSQQSKSYRTMPKKVSSNSLIEMSHSPSSLNVINIDTIKEQLETIMYELQEAETNYTKAASYANADYCSRKAQLVALQLFHLNKLKFNALQADLSMIVKVINLDSNQVKDFINQCNHFYEALIVSKSYPEVNIEWADPFFNIAIVNNNTKYVWQFLEIIEISVSFLEKLIKRFELFSTLFRQQNSKLSSSNQKESINSSSSAFSSSPLSASLMSFLSQIRSEIELQKIFLILEQIIECILCDESMSYIQISLKDKYRLATRLNSQKIIKRLLNRENSAYLLDLKSNKTLYKET